jgi:hypothetical protein
MYEFGRKIAKPQNLQISRYTQRNTYVQILHASASGHSKSIIKANYHRFRHTFFIKFRWNHTHLRADLLKEARGQQCAYAANRADPNIG